MDAAQTRASRVMDALFRTGYPHPINLFVALVLTLLPVLAPMAGASEGDVRPVQDYWLAGFLAVGYLLVWSRVSAYPERSTRFYQLYLTLQAVAVSLIYVLAGGLTRFLFVAVAVQAVYVSPVRRWAPLLGTVGALWLTLYLGVSPEVSGSSMVSIIGMYLLYLIFAALVTFTMVQQEKQVQVARKLLEAVDERHQVLRDYDLTVEHLAEVEERERLAQTIYADLVARLSSLMQHLNALLETGLDRQMAREVRLEAKDVMSSVREAVRTLRPGPGGSVEDEEEGGFHATPMEPEVSDKLTEPLRIYHVWNLGVIVITAGVAIASDLVAGAARWLPLLGAGLGLMAAYGGSTIARQPWSRTFYLVLQAGLCVWTVWLSQEPLMNHLLLMIAGQIIFLVPLLNRWVVAAVAFPTALSAAALWSTGLYVGQWRPLISMTAAFAVTYMFSAVMAFMTRRQVEARQEAILYARQMALVNRQLEQKLQQVRRMVIARERIRMAREIHDGLGHHLTTVIMELQFVEQLADEDQAAAFHHMRSAQGLIAVAMETSREMFAAMERFERPLPDALRELVNAWRAGNRATVSLKVYGDYASLPAAARVTLYRAVQESLTNIQKHAHAEIVEITLLRQPNRVSLTILNDDTGERPQADAGKGGFGLIGLRERADALQGEFFAAPRPEGGFQVKLVLPLGV